MKLTNAITAGLIFVGGISFTEAVTAGLGIMAFVIAIIINLFSLKVKKSAKKRNEAETLLAEEQLKRLKEE